MPDGPGMPEPDCAADVPLWTGDEERYQPADAPRPGRERDGDLGRERDGDLGRGRDGDLGRGRDGGLGRGGWDRGTESGRRAKARTARARDTEDDESRDPAELAREICLRQLGVRPRTRAELAKVLRKQGIADEVAAEVLDRYDEVGLIDDEAFARAWVTSRHHGRGLARRALAGELRQRGVDGEVVGAALEELDPATEAATARELVERKLRSMGKAAPEVAFRRLVGLLARKGYSAGLAVTVVKDAMAATRDQTGDRELAAFVEVVNPDALTDLIGEPDASFTGETEAHGS